MTWLPWTLRVVATLILILVSAKTHGRQVRLLRERHGVARVDFRRDNGPVVEAIWRQDRWVFWSTFGFLAVFTEMFVLILALDPSGLVIGSLVALVLSFCGGFAVSGLWALVKGARGPANAIHPSTGGITAVWWSGVAASWALALWLLWH